MPDSNPASVSPKLQEEIWKVIAGWEALYEISNKGRCRRIAAWKRGMHGQLPYVLNPGTRGRYLIVLLHSDGVKQVRSVSELVAEAFIGPRPPGMQINHIDGNRRNNSAENLEYVTCAENIRHAWRTGLAKARSGEDN